MMLKIEFEEQVWAQIINMLAEMPYKQSGAIINTMAQQINEQRLPMENAGGNGSIRPAAAAGTKATAPAAGTKATAQAK
jgi:hypothetical protein